MYNHISPIPLLLSSHPTDPSPIPTSPPFNFHIFKYFPMTQRISLELLIEAQIRCCL